MFKSGLAIHRHSEIVFEAASLGRDVEAVLASDFGDPLMLLALRLHVLLQGDDAVAGESLDILFGDFVAGEVVVAESIARVQRIAGRECAWANHFSRVHQFCRRKNILRPRGGIEGRRDSVREIAGDFVIVRRSDSGVFAVVVRVHIDEAGNDCFAFDVDDAIDSGGGTFADARDARAANNDSAVFDDFAIVERENSRVCQCE